MKKIFNLFFIATLLVLTSCERSSNTWENVKTAGRYLQKGVNSLWGKDSNSYWVQSEEDFKGPDEEDFIPLNEQDLKSGFSKSDKNFSQPKENFGEGGLPGFDNFKTPSHLAAIFKKVYFQTDDHVLRDKEDLIIIQKISNYMKNNPNVYLCAEGHCDERASAAYNMALGTRRSNHLRVLLIKHGIDFNRIYTVSYGREKPITIGHTSQDWHLNRRGEFKIFEKQK
ncbi:MAG: Peptidoglycan-associated lipoprotein [Candidatus Anoxychlamydiales bacterium]|nr:Peptidoglycan-associated lipoprotein [Candidatus Anoxychlamydiales bacterium]